MTEYDSPWKEILDKYFEEFMQICFPELYQAIDWRTPPKMLDKEFQQIAQNFVCSNLCTDEECLATRFVTYFA